MSTATDFRSGVLLRRSSGPAVPPTSTPTPPRDVTHAAPTPPSRRDRGDRRTPFTLTPAISWSLAGAILVVFAVSIAVEPAANGPEPVAPVWLDLLAVATILAALGAIIGLTAVERFGIWLAAATGAGLVVLTVLCPVSGHHVPGSHTYVQFALAGGLLAASTLILRMCGPPTNSGRPNWLV
jgi:hypothetical protein